MKNEFERKLDEIKKKYADELNTTRNEMIAKLKREYGKFSYFKIFFYVLRSELIDIFSINSMKTRDTI